MDAEAREERRTAALVEARPNLTRWHAAMAYARHMAELGYVAAIVTAPLGTVLVTGGTGRIGKEVIARLAASGAALPARRSVRRWPEDAAAALRP